jgi:hypothetical protein
MCSSDEAAAVRIRTEAGVDDVSYSWACEHCGELGAWTSDREMAEADGACHRCPPSRP